MTFLVLLLTTLLGAAAPGVAGPAPPVSATTPTAPTTPTTAASPAQVLHAWDERRAAAWAAGDPRALARLYTARSAAGAADTAMLRAWQARGLRILDLRMQLLAVDTRRRTPYRLVVVVSDRVASGVAVGGGVRRALPRDSVSTRRLVLVRVAGEWLVAQASPVRTTASAVRSRNR